VVGILAERQLGAVRLFVNAENLGDVRQTRVDPLVLPSRGEGGRWTTPVWSLVEGRTINAGAKIGF
jgi:iron complex outermembrane receptor protein